MVSARFTAGSCASISPTNSGADVTANTVVTKQQRGRKGDQPAHKRYAAVRVVALGAGPARARRSR